MAGVPGQAPVVTTQAVAAFGGCREVLGPPNTLALKYMPLEPQSMRSGVTADPPADTAGWCEADWCPLREGAGAATQTAGAEEPALFPQAQDTHSQFLTPARVDFCTSQGRGAAHWHGMLTEQSTLGPGTLMARPRTPQMIPWLLPYM